MTWAGGGARQQRSRRKREKDGVEAEAGGGAREPAGGGLDERQKFAEAIADAAETALAQMEQSERGRQEKDPLARPCIGAG